eukprot:Gb_09071 [translate_table: standard]
MTRRSLVLLPSSPFGIVFFARWEVQIKQRPALLLSGKVISFIYNNRSRRIAVAMTGLGFVLLLTYTGSALFLCISVETTPRLHGAAMAAALVIGDNKVSLGLAAPESNGKSYERPSSQRQYNLNEDNDSRQAFENLYEYLSYFLEELGPLFFPNPTIAVTNRRLYCILLWARPVGFFFLSCLATLGI